MAIFQTQLYDKEHKKVMALGSIEQMVQAYNMAKLAMGGDYEVQPHGCQKDGKAYTFDIVFVNDTDEVHMGLDTTLMECIRYLTERQGTKKGYFGKYAGGKALVGIYCIEEEVLVYYCHTK